MMYLDKNSDKNNPKILAAAPVLLTLMFITGCTSNPISTVESSPKSDASPAAVNSSLPEKSPKFNQTLMALSVQTDPKANSIIQQYINTLVTQGFAKNHQGIWIQASHQLLSNHQGNIPLPAASLTKVATTLAALKTFNPHHEFVTQIGTTGTINQGVLTGDLVISGGQDPFFVWEEAITVANLLHQIGIKKVTGNLVITGKFYMNFESNPQTSGEFFRQALNYQLWPQEATTQYQTLPPNTPKPEIILQGNLEVLPTPPASVKPLIKHHSLPLAELTKKMNQYSNNLMAEMLANAVGGPQVVAQIAAEAAGVPRSEIQLVNGSGLSEENRISPRAVCGMFLALEGYLESYQMTVADVFTITGKDKGILEERQLPPLAIVKSGTLDTVSALAGALPTQKQGIVWFVMMNSGNNIDEFRHQQERLLKNMLSQWGAVDSLPPELTPNPERKAKKSRSEIVQ